MQTGLHTARGAPPIPLGAQSAHKTPGPTTFPSSLHPKTLSISWTSGNFTELLFSCTSLYWHLYLPRQFGKHAHPYMFTHTTIIHIIKMKILLIKVKNQFITNKNSKMELVDLMLKFLWLLKYVRISNFIKEEEK